MEIKEIRAKTGLSQMRFSEKYNIPKITIEQWETQKRTPPEYVIELLNFKVEYDLEKAREFLIKSAK